MRSPLILLLATALGASEPVTVSVSGRLLDVDGVSEVPRGLFGVHNAQLSAELVADWGVELDRRIDLQPRGGFGTPPAGLDLQVTCLYDRFQPPLQLGRPGDWQDFLRELGTTMGESAKTLGRPAMVEFWNEPYLNWVSKPGITRDPHWYDSSDAVEGGRVRIRGQTEPVERLRWQRGTWWVNTRNAGDRVGTASRVGTQWHRFRATEPGSLVEIGSNTYRLDEAWLAIDPGQPTWWSGPQMQVWYSEMLRVFGTALKASNPEVQLAAGWGFEVSQGGWKAWEILGKPTLDSCIDLIDAWHEHHYGGDPRANGTMYATIASYALHTHGKRLRFWNTETGSNYDPQRPDSAPGGSGAFYQQRYENPQLRQARIDADYTCRELIYLIDRVPALAETRAEHHPQHSRGVPWAFRLLKPLRGALLETTSTDWEILVAASRPAEDQLVVAIWNDATSERSMNAHIAAPAGQRLVTVSKRELTANSAGDGLELHTSNVDLSAPLTLAPRSAVVLVATLAGEAAPAVTQRRVSYPASDILGQVSSTKALSWNVQIPADILAQAQAARLVLGQLGVSDGGSERVSLNGHEQAIGAGTWLVRHAIPVTALTANTALTLTDSGDGFHLWSAWIELDLQQP